MENNLIDKIEIKWHFNALDKRCNLYWWMIEKNHGENFILNYS